MFDRAVFGVNMSLMNRATKFPAEIMKFRTCGDREAARLILRMKANPAKFLEPLYQAAERLDDNDIRKWSLQALGEFRTPRSLKILKAALNPDQKMTVKLHALRGLSRRGQKVALSQIVALLKDESGGIRMNALQTLAALNARSERTQIKRCLRDEKIYIRKEAAKILQAWGA